MGKEEEPKEIADPWVVTEANCVVAEKALKDEWEAKRRAEICRCGTCKKRVEEAIDGVMWGSQSGKYRPDAKVTVIIEGCRGTMSRREMEEEIIDHA